MEYPAKPQPNAPEREWMKWKQQMKKFRSERKDKKLKKQGQREKSKRQKLSSEQEDEVLSGSSDDKRTDQAGRPYTVSIALPGSILDNAQSAELRTYLAGQIARAAVIFNVDEIIVFDETGSSRNNQGEVGKQGNANVKLARILQFLECPQYLRKSFFPIHSDLQYAGLLNPLDCPHHTRATEPSPFREGVVLDRPAGKNRGSSVYVGLKKDVKVDIELQAGIRVTVELDDGHSTETAGKHFSGKIVSPSYPREQHGLYWGYTVRLAQNLGEVFTSCPYKDGYDMTIGTSERGKNADGVQLPRFRHMLVVFGGVKGLEYSLDNDENLEIEEPSLLFDYYLNTCFNQGSRTIRTEEAILVTMSLLRPKIAHADVNPP